MILVRYTPCVACTVCHRQLGATAMVDMNGTTSIQQCTVVLCKHAVFCKHVLAYHLHATRHKNTHHSTVVQTHTPKPHTFIQIWCDIWRHIKTRDKAAGIPINRTVLLLVHHNTNTSTQSPLWPQLLLRYQETIIIGHNIRH
jgi:hypothetical protein